MCIIAVKKPGVPPLPENKVKICFNNNQDGAGFAVMREGSEAIHIRKGFMTLEEMNKALEEAEIQINDTVVYHFRIATSGGVKPEMTHPFPISHKKEDLYATDIVCTRAFAHNGVFGKGSDDFSDTQLFAKTHLCLYTNIEDNIGDILMDVKTCRVVIMLEKKLYLLGTWEEDSGYYYSNATFRYEKNVQRTYTSTGGYWDTVEGKWKQYTPTKTREETYIECPECKQKKLNVRSQYYARCDNLQCNTTFYPCKECREWTEETWERIDNGYISSKCDLCPKCLEKSGQKLVTGKTGTNSVTTTKGSLTVTVTTNSTRQGVVANG